MFSHDDRYLPRPELTKFNGNPLEYKTFMNNFERHIVPKVRDSKILLCYLSQQCEPSVRNKLQHFSNKGDAGFHLAKARLKTEYGQPCVIADACEQQLKAAKYERFNDPEMIKRFAELLEKTVVTIEDINFSGSLNSLDTMTQLVNKLPRDRKRTWVKESLEIEKGTGEVAGFSYFVELVTRLSDEANSLYGRRVLGPHSSYSKFQSIYSDHRKPAKSYNVVVTKSFNSKPSNINSFACFYCKESSHGLLTCPKFKDAPMQERSLFIKQNKYCYKRFKF